MSSSAQKIGANLAARSAQRDAPIILVEWMIVLLMEQRVVTHHSVLFRLMDGYSIDETTGGDTSFSVSCSNGGS